MKLFYSVDQIQPFSDKKKTSDYVFWIIISGSGELYSDQGRISFVSHDVLEIPHNLEISLIASSPIMIGQIMLTDFPIYNDKIRKINHTSTDLVRRLFYSALDLIGSDHPAQKQLLGSQDQMLINTLLCHENISDKHIPVIRPVIDAINKHFTETDFDVTPYINASGYSINHFRKIFTDIVGVPPLRFQQTRRLEYAKSLLENNSDMTIKEIANQSGFSDAYYFTRLFTKENGVSPSEYRQGI